jgi:hypothetical protein
MLWHASWVVSSRSDDTSRAARIPALILRDGTLVAIRLGLPHTNNWVDAFSRVNPHDFQHILTLLRQTAKRRKCWHARRD